MRAQAQVRGLHSRERLSGLDRSNVGGRSRLSTPRGDTRAAYCSSAAYNTIAGNKSRQKLLELIVSRRTAIAGVAAFTTGLLMSPERRRSALAQVTKGSSRKPAGIGVAPTRGASRKAHRST